jgi:Uma2 family endonuclease
MLYWQREMSRFESREEKSMAMFSRHNRSFEQIDWTGRPMSEEEYHELEEISPERKYEYIKGVAYMMSGGSIEHDQITYNTRVALTRRLRAGPCRVFGTDVQVLLGQKKNNKAHFVYPDATVSCNAADQRRGNTLVENPRVVVEVLSPSTEARDRGIKFKAYQLCPTIQEIVLVNQYLPYVEVWQRNDEQPDNPKAWHYRHYGPGEEIELFSLNIRLAMAEIYQDLDFAEDEEEDDEE